MPAGRGSVITLLLVTVLTLGACRQETPAPPPATSASATDAAPTERVVGPLTNVDAEALVTMNQGLKAYIELHRMLEETLPKLPDTATPEQIDTNQRALEQLVRKARATAKPGEIFTAEARPVIKRLLANVFAEPDGKQLKASIMDENPVGVRLAVNARYPDTVPISTMPPQVLQTLPKLTEDLEYRFIGDSLILLDTHAHIIVDYIEGALPI